MKQNHWRLLIRELCAKMIITLIVILAALVVILAQAGIQKNQRVMDSRFRGNDKIDIL
jgi:hypothetical protein